MKIDNILNKEKSPDKATIAERTASIEDIKKSQKFFEFNDLSSTTNINNNLLQEQEAIYDYLPPSTSKLKKLLLNSDLDALGDHHQNSGFLTNNLVNTNSATTKNSLVKPNNESNALSVTVNNRKNNNNNINIAKKSAKNANKQKLFLCSECNEHFLKLHLFNHIKSVHNKFTCLYCYGFFADAGALEKHLVKKHKVQNTTFYDEHSLQNFLSQKPGGAEMSPRVVFAVCCKCGLVYSITDGNFGNHSCSGQERALEVPTNLQPQSMDQNHIENAPQIVQNDLDSGKDAVSAARALEAAKEDFYCDQAIQQWCQPNFKPTNQEGSGLYDNLEPASVKVQETVKDASSLNELQGNNEWPEVEDKQVEEKLVVPKLTLKIPKAFQHQQFNNIESEEESLEEEGSSSEDDNERSINFSNKLSKSNERDIYSSSLSETDNETNEPELPKASETPKKQENMPSLKLKIKNLASNNPESVLENFDFRSENEQSKTLSESIEQEQHNDVDMTECPMDLEPETVEEEREPEPEPAKLIIVDGVVVTPANEDVQTLEISLNEGLDKVPIVKFMKICLKASIPFCLYCNHARKIVVNGRALATHFITHHRFHAMVESITAEELHPEKIVDKLESCIDELKPCYFNLETFDNQDEEKKEGHVTISHDKLYECFQCRFQTPIQKELYLHNRKMHQKSIINCLMCKMSFYSYSELLCHICPGVTNKQGFLDYKFYCCLCNLDNIPSAFRLMVHLRKKHYACDVCLEKCSDQSKLSSHVWKHKLFHLCYRCNISYRNKADIMKHLFWKHGTEGIECKKCLQKKWPHLYHFCAPPAAFTCTHCEMSFARAMALNVHMRLHEDGAKYACTEIECEKKFVSRKLLLRHLERHQQETATAEGENAGEEKNERSVVIPAEIPEGFCTRTMPIVFKRVTRKPRLRKLENEVIPEAKPEPEAKKSEENDPKALPALPETNLNLSESSDSSSSDSDEDVAGGRSIESLAALVEAQIENSGVPAEETNDAGEVNKTSTLQELAKISSLSDSDDDDETDVKKEKKPDDDTKMDTSEISQIEPIAKTEMKNNVKVEGIKVEDTEATVKEDQEEVEDKLPENINLHVCQSDHDYAVLKSPPASGLTAEDYEEVIKNAKIEKAKRKEERAAAKAERRKNPRPKNDDFSSSDSSSGSSSDTSSASSSGSSSSSSSSSGSSSSGKLPSNLDKKRSKKFSKKRAKKEKKEKVEAVEPEVPLDPDDIICESDLVTDETDTDEDFYDEHPLKLDSILAEKRKQLLKGGVIDGIVENSRPSTPSLPPDEKIEKMKKKKRKKEHRKSSSPSKRSHNDSSAIVNPGDASMNYFNNSLFNNPPETPQMNKFNFHHTSTPVSAPPRIELHQANQIRQLLQSTTQQPVLPILKEQHQQQQQQQLQQHHYYHSQTSNMSMDYVNVSHVPSIASSATSSRKNSDSEQSNLKRSQRRRIPNKFYGYTSDDESMAAQLALNPNDPFKPIPPPQLTWRKEDLPAKSKSPSSTPRIAPLKLTLGGDQLQQQLQTFATEHMHAPSPQMFDYSHETTLNEPPQQMPANVPHFNLSANVNPRSNRPSESDSTDEDQLHISEPRRRKRKLPSQANAMYAFHTLETPPIVAQPPIPRLKLTIGSNNKIRRRNINPLKVTNAKKRKLNNGPKKNPPPVATPPVRGTFNVNPYAKQYDLQPPPRLLQSPTFDQSLTQPATTSRQMIAQGVLEKQQKLQEAILNTQQYFQRFNHTQVTNAEITREDVADDEKPYCYCRRPYNEEQGMIGCDGVSCSIEWFHFECVGILVPPKGNWYCPECTPT